MKKFTNIKKNFTGGYESKPFIVKCTGSGSAGYVRIGLFMLPSKMVGKRIRFIAEEVDDKNEEKKIESYQERKKWESK